MFPSPLMVGGELDQADDWTVSLLTNPEVLAVDQHSSGNRPVIVNDAVVVWLASAPAKDAFYVAAFNRTAAPRTVQYSWKDLGLAGESYRQRDLWQHADLGTAGKLSVVLPPHGCLLYRLDSSAAPR